MTVFLDARRASRSTAAPTSRRSRATGMPGFAEVLRGGRRGVARRSASDIDAQAARSSIDARRADRRGLAPVGASRSTADAARRRGRGLARRLRPRRAAASARAPKFPPAVGARVPAARRGERPRRSRWPRRRSTRWPPAASTTRSAAASTATRSTTRWLVPHFEKMLYDNALLALGLPARLGRHRATSATATVVEETLDYVLRELRAPGRRLLLGAGRRHRGRRGADVHVDARGAAARRPAAELLEPFEHGRSIVRGELDPELRRACCSPSATSGRSRSATTRRSRRGTGSRSRRSRRRAYRLERADWLEARAAARRVPARAALGATTAGSTARGATARVSGAGLSRRLRERRARPDRAARRDGRAALAARGAPARAPRGRALRRRRARRLLPRRRRTASSSSRARRTSRTPRSRRGTRCSRTSCCGSARIWGDDELERTGRRVFRLVEPALGRAPGRLRVDALRARPLARAATRDRDRRRRRLAGRARRARSVPAEHGRRGRPVRRRAAARGQGPRRREAGRLRLRALRLPRARDRGRRVRRRRQEA